MKSKCFIDIHAHLDGFENIQEVIDDATKSDVKIIVAQGTNKETNRKVLALAAKYPTVKAALGLYPIEALKLKDKEIDEELDFIRQNADKIVAIGEVGIDFKESTDKTRQLAIFTKIIKLAKETGKPLIIHSRKAEKEVIELLEKEKAKKVVMHCFCGKFSLAKRIAENGWMLTIPTSATRSVQFQDIAREISIDNLLCETDSPYLHPDREWPNTPKNVVRSYEIVAKIKNLPVEKVKESMYKNYSKLL